MDYVKKIEVQMLLQHFIKYGEIHQEELNDICKLINVVFKQIYNNITLKESNKIVNNCLLKKSKTEYIINYDKIITTNMNEEEKLEILRKRVAKLRELPQPEQRSQEWYDTRRRMITASDVATALGLNPYSKKKELILKKCNVGIPFTGNKYTQHGVKYEPVATYFYEMLKNAKIIEFGLIPHPELLFLGASPDGITLDGIMLEIKCPFTRKIKTTGELQGVPLYYWVQMQIQLEVCNLEECDFLQCSIEEYKNKTEFTKDKKTETKGVIIEKIKDESKDEFNKYEYIYPQPFNITKKKDIDTFIKQNENINDVKYWKLVEYGCVRVKRDRKWFLNNLVELKKFWDDVLYYRKNGVDELMDKQVNETIAVKCLF